MPAPRARGATQPASAPTSRSSDTALQRTILAATLVAAFLRLFRLGHQSLWIDEQFTLAAAGLPGRIAWRDLLQNVHGPLHTLAVAVAASLGGTSEWVLRLPGALAGIAMVPAMAWLAARWSGRETAAPAAWLAAGSPFLVYYAQECRNYAFLMLAAALATAALLECERRCDARAVARYALLAAAGLLSNFAFALLAPFHLLRAVAPGPTRRARLTALAVVGAVLVLVALPWLPAARGIFDWSRLSPARAVPAGEAPLRGETTFHPAAYPFALHAFCMGYSGGPSLRELRAAPLAAARTHAGELLGAAAVFGVLGVAGLAALRRRGRLGGTLVWLIAPALVVGYFAANNFKTFHPRYVSVSLPALMLVLAAAFADLAPRWRRILAAAVVVLWAGALARAAFDPAYGREDYRGALAHVRAGFTPGERVLAVGAPEPVEWYGRGLPVARWWLGFAADPARLEHTFADSLAGWRGTWVVASREEDLDPAGRFAAWLDRRVPESARWQHAGVRVWHVVSEPAEATGPSPARRETP